ncbi:hypothetical protein C6N75_24390 [Streptomyces solincola]|uniref:FtsK domain-containing protein n=1 Tax=Streptomyces solincola TaxID=2100817 RepID=A0A2S9PQH3_9ACTN|nr:FtsK/SpoIIIE domain-containing protein [Streptomyces solincola]PRH76666.1 hypothetical protein C6N75_24390 [Streptomyces solincola]
MAKKRTSSDAEDELWGQAAGAIGALVIVTGILVAIRDKLGLSWGATVLLVAGVLVALGYAAWRTRTWLLARWRSVPEPAAGPADQAVEEAGPPVRPHPLLTTAFTKAGVIKVDQVIDADEVTVTQVSTGRIYEFLLPEGGKFEDVENRLAAVAGMFRATRLHLKVERSRREERRVKLLVLDDPPFTRPFPAPTRQEIKAHGGVPLGHEITGQVFGVETLDKASMLVAGMSQTGKTTLVNGMVTCLLIAYESFDLYLVDGKLAGFAHFSSACARFEASDDPAVFESVLDELNGRVEKRYTRMQEAKQNRQPAPRFKPVILIVDEVADFFADDGTQKGRDRAARITEKARKLTAKGLEAGVSVVLMTQRPDREAIPVKVRSQLQYRLCLYVDSSGTAKVALGDNYFDSVAPIHPKSLDPGIKGQAVLFARGTSTLIRGFDFPESFMWHVVDEAAARLQKSPKGAAAPETAPASPVDQAIAVLQEREVDFMPTAELAPLLGIEETDPIARGKRLSKLLGVQAHRTSSGARGYLLTDLAAAADDGS